jgi:hypothetical protein
VIARYLRLMGMNLDIWNDALLWENITAKNEMTEMVISSEQIL